MNDHRKTPLEPETIEPQSCSIDLRRQILGRVPFFADLDPSAIDEINRLFREEGYQTDDVIYFSGDPARRLYVVAAGKIKLLRHSLGGQDVLLDVLVPGELFGSLAALGDNHYQDTAQAQTAACVLGIGAEDFRTVLQRYPPVALAVLDGMADRLKAAHEAVHQLSTRSVEQRIAATLLKLGEKLGQEKEIGLLIQMPLSRDDLAEMTGTTPETASRIMSQFQKDGLIRSGRQWVALTDPQKLSTIAEGSSN